MSTTRIRKSQPGCFTPLRRQSDQEVLTLHLQSDPALLRRQQALLVQSRNANLGLEYVGLLPLFSGYRAYPGQNHDWLFMNMADDPLLDNPYGFPVPRQVLRRLQRIVRIGITFDMLYVAHELPAGTLTADTVATLDLLAPPPSAAALAEAALLGSLSRALWAVALAPIAAVSLVTRLAVNTSAVIVGGDPILFGVALAPGQQPKPGDPAAWFYLDHWAYNAME